MVLDSAAGASFRCSIAPWLSVPNGAKAVDFYKSAFGATEVYRLEDPGGGVVARLSIDGAEFWLSGESAEQENSSPPSLAGSSIRRAMNHREGFLANLVTATLVGPAAALGLPMSTTHVASGAIFAVATRQDQGANRMVIWEMLLAWIVTVPGAAALGVASLLLAKGLGLK